MGQIRKFKCEGKDMPLYETIPTRTLLPQNAVDPTSDLPELVHFDDTARSVFFDFSKSAPATIAPQTTVDEAIHDIKVLHLPMLLVEDKGRIVGLVSHEDLLSEKPLTLMQENSLDREEVTVAMLMKPHNKIVVIDIANLKNARVGHIVNTFKEHSVDYILVVKKSKEEKHLIKGLFSASQVSRQLHADITSLIMKSPDSILELHKERKV
jgi:CBS domain containing-hemolysin-like protein